MRVLRRYDPLGPLKQNERVEAGDQHRTPSVNLKDHMNSVKITANDDGTYTVEAEEPEMDMEAEGMEDEASEPSTQVATIDEAFDLARQMLDQGSASEPMIEGEKEFVQGFQQARGE